MLNKLISTLEDSMLFEFIAAIVVFVIPLTLLFAGVI